MSHTSQNGASMFTGLIEGIGKVVRLEKNSTDAHIYIEPKFSFPSPVLGESVAINGVCLTVESAHNNVLSFYASAETLSCTNLDNLNNGSLVNMERALALGSRLGGHLVSGHVDFIGTVEKIHEIGHSRCFRIGFENTWAPYFIPKGSVTLDGISLTINACESTFLEVNVIPETWKVTTLSNWKQGQRVNVETDMIGKYILRFQKYNDNKQTSRINESFLRDNGFF